MPMSTRRQEGGPFAQPLAGRSVLLISPILFYSFNIPDTISDHTMLAELVSRAGSSKLKLPMCPCHKLKYDTNVANLASSLASLLSMVVGPAHQ